MPATIDVNPYPDPKPQGKNDSGQNEWIGHIYDGKSLESIQYIGNYQEPEAFDQNFGRSQTCFPLSNGYSIYTETFSVRYNMKSTRKGLYTVDLGSDDGGRLRVDNMEVYSSWGDQSYKEVKSLLLNLNGNSQLEYDFYENGGDNRVRFSTPILLLKNELSKNLEQTLCPGAPATEISGDRFTTLPAGVTTEGTGYQWYYSTSQGGAGTLITGATSAAFTPDVTKAPFNSAGTYFIYRQVSFFSSANTGKVTHRSNSAVLTVKEPISNNKIEIPVIEKLPGTVWGTANKGQVLRLQAPEGYVFDEVVFASYGNPTGSGGNFSQGLCHASQSKTIVENVVLGKNSATIAVNETNFPSNWLLGLCEVLTGGNFRLYVKANYKPIEDSGNIGGGTLIEGSLPTGGNGSFTYLWESSTSGPEGAFSPAPVKNTLQDYQVGELYTTTWFKRTVFSDGCTLESNIIKIEVRENLWTGKFDTNWHDTRNWSLGSIPNSRTNAVIPVNVPNFPLVSKNLGAIYHLRIDAGARLEIRDQWFSFSGAISGNGEIIAERGSISFSGEVSDVQTLPAGRFRNQRIQNLHIGNTFGVHSSGPLEITGFLNVEEGTFHTKDVLTLISNQQQTALIDGLGMGQVIGKVTVQRYLNPAYGYKYFSAPVTGVKVGDFAAFTAPLSSTGFPHFYRYDEARKKDILGGATGWIAYTKASDPLNVFEGYAVNFGRNNKPVTVSVTGEVHNGAYSRVLNNSKGTYTKGFNLVGNPYPSPIDWNAANGWTKTNIDNAIYFFTTSDSDPYTGEYSSYVNGISSTDNKSSNIIPSMQGYFIHVNEAHSQGTLAMDNKVRVVDYNQAFLKSAQPKKPALLRLSARFENETLQDPMVVYFDRQASPAFDSELDALKMMNTQLSVPNLYSFSTEDKELSINAIPEAGTGELLRLPLGVKIEKSGTLIFNLQDLEEAFAGYHIYLVDLQRKHGKELGPRDSYSVPLDKGTHHSRFELVLSQNRITDPAILTKELFSASADGKTLTINLNLEVAREGEILVSNLSGQTIRTLRFNNQKEVKIDGIKSSGVYIISVKTGETLTSKKILIN